MKKRILLLLCLAMALSLQSCAGKPPKETGQGSAEKKTAEAQEVGEAPADSQPEGSGKEQAPATAAKDAEEFIDDGGLMIRPGAKALKDSYDNKNPFGVELPSEFTPVDIVDSDQFAVTVQGLAIDRQEVVLSLALKNKSDQMGFNFSIQNGFIDGVWCRPYLSEKVEAGQTRESDVRLWAEDYFTYGSSKVTDLCLRVAIRDAEDYSGDQLFDEWVHLYPFGEEKAESFSRQKQARDQVFMDNDDVHVDLLGYKMKTSLTPRVVFYLQNKSEASWTFSTESGKLNDEEVDPRNTAITLEPGTSAFLVVEWDESYMNVLGIEEATKLEFSLVVTDEDSVTPSYQETFQAGQ